jgi:hypothetical protein
MARKPPTTPPSTSSGQATYRRLTKSELRALGFGSGSKRRVIASVKRVTKRTPAITDRQYAQLKLEKRLGKKTTKEQFSKAVKSGEATYTQSAQTASDTKFIKRFLPDVAKHDLGTMHKYYRGGYSSLSDKDKQSFRNLFQRYSRDDVRQALGSAPKDTGAFPT